MSRAKLQECIIKFKTFNKTLNPHNRNRWLIPSRSVGSTIVTLFP